MPRFTFASVLKIIGWLLVAFLLYTVCQRIPAAYR